MAEHIAYGPTQAAVIEHTHTVLGVDTASEVPNPLPASFIQVMRVGGSHPTPVSERVMLTFLCWAPTKTAAEQLALDALAAVQLLRTVEGLRVKRCVVVGGVAESPDPDRASPRYQFTVTLHLSVAIIQAP